VRIDLEPEVVSPGGADRVSIRGGKSGGVAGAFGLVQYSSCRLYR